MGFGNKIIGFLSGLGADVDANNQLKVALPVLPANAGYAKMMGKGALTTSPEILQGYDGRTIVGVDNVLFKENVDTTAVNVNRWNTSASVMSISNAGGFIQLGGGLLTPNAYAVLSTKKSFQLLAHATLVAKFNFVLINADASNVTIEAGLGTVSGNAPLPTDGVFVRLSGAIARAVTNYNSAETVLNLASGRPANAVIHECKIIMDSTTAQFFIDDVLQATVDVGNTQQAALVNNSRQPFFMRVFIGASPASTAPAVWLGNVLITQGHLPQNRSWSETQALNALGAYLQPLVGFGQTPNHANSTSPTSATLSNTVAGYATLGGRFQFAAPAGAATDYALFAFQVPAGHQLKIHSIAISAINTGAAVATTATILDWAVGVDSSAVSLATTDSGSVLGPRRVPLGVQGLVVGAAIGAQANDLRRDFYAAPLVVNGGNYVHVIVQVPVGTATAGQVIRGDVTIEASYE